MAVQENKRKKPDPVLFFLSLVILSFGLIMVLSAGSFFSFNNTENPNPYYLFYKQLRTAGLGLVVMIGAMIFPYRNWKKLSGIGVLLSISLLLLVEYSGISKTMSGSARWLNILGISIQPSEIAKLCIIIFLAYNLSRRPVKKLQDLLMPGFFTAVVLILVYKQPDLGTTVVMALACGALFLMTELPSYYFLTAIPLLGFPAYHLIRNEEYQWNRILGWLHPWDYASSLGFQIVNAQVAFATGGLLGIGIGRGSQDSLLPENYTDMIFSVIGEEFGLFGTTLVLFCFIFFVSRGYLISRQCPDRFGRLLGFGITTTFAIQTAINLCVVTGLFPVTGITLPLISYGGSSLLITMLEIGILLNISCYADA